MQAATFLGAAFAVLLIALVLAVHIYAIVHALQHSRGGMALLLFFFPGLSWIWIPLHHHDEMSERPAS